MKKVLDFLKREIVMSIALVLALVSMLLVKPDAEYAGYIDWDVIMLLFSLMAVVAGLKKCRVFDAASSFLVRLGGDLRRLSILLTLACFFISMVVTNDVALITFVPLTVGMLSGVAPGKLIYIVTLETIAANLGSMATPIGNPQNLYLYSHYAMSGSEFTGAVLPIAAVSLVLLVAACLPISREKLSLEAGKTGKMPVVKLIVYGALLVLCILSVFRVVPKLACCIAVAAAVLVMDRKGILEVDYALLVTFICFFVFVGNIGRLEAVSSFISRVVVGREKEAGILASQVISNVPAALMLSGFTDNAVELMRGVNIGGLGSLVASLASLISFKAYMQAPGAKAGRYIGWFTVVNIIFLALIYAASWVI
ncbi:MAG: citrate transporter [Clostridia bacterium]|nr:citrate transporter [Clostridia bacterium]